MQANLDSPDQRAARFARRVFLGAAAWGAISLLPLPFLKSQIEAGTPITHPEYFYGFIGVCIAFQLVFVVIARDPVRYRPLMLCSVAEKALFVLPALVLVQASLAPSSLLVFAAADALWLLLFARAYARTAASWGARLMDDPPDQGGRGSWRSARGSKAP